MKTLIAALLLAAFLGVNCELTQGEIDTIVNTHNSWRKEVPSSNMYELTWDQELANFAEEWAVKCTVDHDLDRLGAKLGFNRIGENIFLGTTSDVNEMMTLWHDEGKDYKLTENECKAGTYSCLHYTQIMWAKTKVVGCAKMQCGSRNVLVCNYGPAGNYNFNAPYKEGTPCTECKSASDGCKDNLCIPA